MIRTTQNTIGNNGRDWQNSRYFKSILGADRTETGDEYLSGYDELTRQPIAETWSRMGIVLPKKKYRKLSFDPSEGSRFLLNKRKIKGLIGEAQALLDKNIPVRH